MNDIVRKLYAVARALNDVEVKGRDNMNALLGSIQAIERVAGQLEYQLQQMQTKTEPEVKVELVPDEEAPAE